ncbi:hypothetical protein Q8A73_012559 [Channa argus]|nr:hypothetical protein Q8A73_012559 [Channa argus]
MYKEGGSVITRVALMSPSGTMQRTSLQRLLCKYNLNYETFSMRSDKWRHRNRRRQIIIRTFADQTEAKEKPPGSSSSPPLSVVLSVSSISGLVLLVLLVLLVKQCFYRKPKDTDPAAVCSAVRTEDVSYGQIVIKNTKAKTKELPAKTEDVYSSLRSTFTPSPQ